MKGINKVIIVGTLGKDPETRYFPNGDAVATTSVATSEQWTDKASGEKKQTTEWHNVVFHRKLAEIAAQWLTKGSKVYLEGKLKTRKWEKEGQTHYSTEIIVSDMQMLSSKEQAQESEKPKAKSANKGGHAPSNVDDDGFGDRNVPF